MYTKQQQLVPKLKEKQFKNQWRILTEVKFILFSF